MHIDLVESKQTEDDNGETNKNGERWSRFGDGLGWILPTPSLTKERNCAHHNIAFNRKWREPQKAKDRHFKDLQPAYIGHGVFPLG